MSELLKQQITQSLAKFWDPYLASDLIAAKVLKNIDVEASQIVVELEFGFPIKRYEQQLQKALQQHLAALPLEKPLLMKISSKLTAHAVQKGLKGLPQVKNIIAIASGKGGVGKSTVAVNLAFALQAEGARVGLLDADIYGPSQPLMLGTSNCQPETVEDKHLLPVMCHGIQSMSIGYLIDQQDTPMVWRGPMVTRALEQLLFDTLWQDLDYLIIDLPPGTGDIQLTLAQKIPVSGAVIVSTPQDIALLDARKALQMFNKVHVPVLGMIENMSHYSCTQCGHQEAIFGEGGGASMSQQYGVPLLGQLPLVRKIREQADTGIPIVVAEPEGEIAQLYYEIARSMAAKLSLRIRDYTSRFPKIVIE